MRNIKSGSRATRTGKKSMNMRTTRRNSTKPKRGFAAMSVEQRTKVARKGGEAHGRKAKSWIERVFD